ncbi:hypothetical protein [Nodularia sphaerocarpa]|nr:hypothetical protein [Nodularia sphaerocarpa]MDB9373544.1 hypothetical protein [Nodularia sphaerocarpa CS-585]MDB9377656.1 hypothetical protein [Nodularia sphaerocarpa CS-585A2]
MEENEINTSIFNSQEQPVNSQTSLILTDDPDLVSPINQSKNK